MGRFSLRVWPVCGVVHTQDVRRRGIHTPQTAMFRGRAVYVFQVELDCFPRRALVTDLSSQARNW